MRDRLTPIGNYAKIRRGASPRPIDDPAYFGGNVGWVKISDVTASKKYLQKTEKYLSPYGESKSVRVDKGDLVMSICGTVGKPIIIDMPACIHDGFVQIYNIQGLDKEYLYYQLQFSEKALEQKGQPGTQVNLNTTIVGNYEIYVPNEKKQRRIAHILSTCDAVIEKTEAAIAKYQAIKQGMMHDLFTRGIDLNTGKLRPKQEDAPELYKESELGWIPREWDIKKNLELCNYYNGRAYSLHEWEDKGTPVIRLQNLTGSGDTYYYSNLKLPEQQYCKRGDLLYMWSASFGPYIWEKDKAIYHYHIWKIECFPNKLDKMFFYYELEKFTQTVLKKSSGSTMAHITKEGMENRKIPTPCIDEQVKIEKTLSAIQNKIQSEQSTLSKYRQIKAGLMQDLLSGKVEVMVEEKENI